MAVIDSHIAPPSPVRPSLPNMAATMVASGHQQQSIAASPIEQKVQNPLEKQASIKDVQQAVQQANATFSGSNESIAFGYEAKLGQLFVQVTDKVSGEVIREIPSKEFIQHRVFMREMIGLLLDKQA